MNTKEILQGIKDWAAPKVIYDISAAHNNTKYTDLSDALGTNGGNIPQEYRKGGITVRYVQSSDNEYVQYRLIADSWTISPYFWERYNDVTTSNQSGSDLDISDERGNILALFKDGEFETKKFKSKKVPTLKDSDDSAADLDISDEQGNILMQLKGGHIRTKNFNSENNIQNKFKAKKIAIIGDSISTYNGWLPSDIPGYDGATYASYYPRGNVNNVNKTWWHKLATMLGIDETRISNCAWSGSKVTGNSLATNTAEAGCSERRIADLTARGFVPDIIICFISANDWAHNISIGTWKPSDGIPTGGTLSTLMEAYATMLNKLHVNYPLSRIFVCTILDDYRRDGDSLWPSNNGNGISTYEWNENIVELADAFGCEIIDFNKCGINYQNIATYYAVDTGLHPNSAGMELMAQKAFKEIITKY